MTKNDLVLGVPRLGTIFDGNPDTPETRATVELTENGVKLSITWSSDGTEVYGRWFRPRNSFFALEDESNIPDESFKIPSTLNFHDSAGAIQLIDCHSAGWRQSGMGNGFGLGTAFARHAILSTSDRHDYQKVHALSSEVVGLRSWLGITSIHEKQNFSPTTRSASIRLEKAESIVLPKKDHISLVPGWKVSRDDSHHVIKLENGLTIQTDYEKPMTWEDHLIHHGKIRDLLNVSLWKNHDLKISAVKNRNYCEDDGRGGSQAVWKEVRSSGSFSTAEVKAWRHLINYSDLGPEGLTRWMDLSEEFERAINPALTMHRLKGADPEVQISQIGICLEALGYLILMRDDEMPEEKAKKTRYITRFQRIGRDIESVAPFDVGDWARGTVEAYNGVKHANRALPDFLEITNRVRESCLAFRIWIALRLGVDAENLKERLRVDPQATPYELA